MLENCWIGGAAGEVALDDHAAQGGLRAVEVGMNEVKLRAGGVDEDEQHVLAELGFDLFGGGGSLGLADAGGLRDVHHYVKNMDAVEFGRCARRSSGA